MSLSDENPTPKIDIIQNIAIIINPVIITGIMFSKNQKVFLLVISTVLFVSFLTIFTAFLCFFLHSNLTMRTRFRIHVKIRATKFCFFVFFISFIFIFYILPIFLTKSIQLRRLKHWNIEILKHGNIEKYIFPFFHSPSFHIIPVLPPLSVLSSYDRCWVHRGF